MRIVDQQLVAHLFAIAEGPDAEAAYRAVDEMRRHRRDLDLSAGPQVGGHHVADAQRRDHRIRLGPGECACAHPRVFCCVEHG